MPKLIRMYILHSAIGFGLSAVFLALLIWADVAGLRHLILHTSAGFGAGMMLFVMNGIIFAGAQFAIAIMRLADDENGDDSGPDDGGSDGGGPKGGLRARQMQRGGDLRLAPVKVPHAPAGRRK